MFERLKTRLRKAGGARGMATTLQTMTDHPRIAVNPAELRRIEENIRLYAGQYPPVSYLNSYGEERTRPYVSLNLVKVAANRMASLVFNEKCRITADHPAAQEYLDQVFHDNDFHKNFERYLESCFALGGLAVRPYVSDGRMRLSWCQAGAFFPLRANSGGVSEAVIRTVTQRTEHGRQYYYTLLEFHEWVDGVYTVRNELYRSDTALQVGRRVPLASLYGDGLDEETRFPGLCSPLFVYIRPAGMNNLDLGSPFGLGICDNAKPTLGQVNDAYDAFHWEIKSGKRRIGISDHFLSAQYDEGGNAPPRLLEADCDTFLALPGGIDDMVRQEWSFDIRSGQYMESISYFIKTFEMQAGFSAGTFRFDGSGVRTATEVVSENSITYQTRNSHVTAVEKAIRELVGAVLSLGSIYRLYDGPVDVPVGIDFDDGVFVDKEKQLDFYGKAKQFGLIPAKEAVMRVFDLPEQTAEDWVSRTGKQSPENTPDIPKGI